MSKGAVDVDKHPDKQPLGKGFNFAVTAFCIILAIFFFLRSNLFSVQTVTIEGNVHLTKEQVLSLIGTVESKNIFDIDLRQVQQRILQVPFVESVHLTRQLPSSIVIEITERKPYIAIPTDEGFAILDEEGRLLSLSDLPRLTVPLLTGIPIDNIKPGDVISGNELALAIHTTKLLGPDLTVRISEIMIENGQVNLITRDLVTVYLGEGTRIEEKLNTLRVLIKKFEGSSECIKFIDLRVPNHPVTGC